jgi:PAS domain S-box-containing protein
MNYYQLGILLLQGTLVSFLILLLFYLRKKLGIGILFACLGLFQFMQVFLSSTVYVELANNFLVSPGSSVLFTATLFAILIIYIKEDASETRKIIYALLIANIVMSVLIQSIGWNIKESSSYNPLNVSTNLFSNNAWVLFVGTLALFLDSIFIIIIYEFTSRHLSGLFLRICLTMIIVLSFDTTFFSIIAFWNYDNLNTILVSGLISKGIFAIFYSIIFSIYLKYIETRELKTDSLKFYDVFKPLSYRQKFEEAKLDAIKTSEEVKLKEIKYQTLANISPVGIFHSRSDGYTTYVNPKWCEISGLTMNEALGNGWLKAVHPDDIKHIKNEWEQAIFQKRTSETQYRFLLSDGSVKWVLGRAVPELDNHNQIIGYIGTITDITNIKLYQDEQIILNEKAEESEKTFKKLFDESSDAILLIDSSGVFVECNQAALDLLKTTREQFLFNSPVSISPEFQPNGQKSDAAATEMIRLAYENGLHRFDWTHTNFENEEFIVEVSLMPIVIKGQTMLHTSWRNITERKKVEEELLNLKIKLEERVEEQTKELSQKIEELERMNKLFIGREVRIKELKDKIKEMENKNL